MARRLEELLLCIETRHHRSLQGVLEARAVDPGAFERCAERFLSWAAGAIGDDAIPRAVAAFARFSSDVNLAQGRYEIDGHYENKSYADCKRALYDKFEAMSDYLWGVYLTNFLWAHHMELMLFFEARFVSRLKTGWRIIELAPGHGGWGLSALHAVPDTELTGIDISAASLAIATDLSIAAGLAARTNYVQRDALQLQDEPSMQADACICCFLVEHLERPAELLRTMAHVLAPGGVAFFTGALTAAQVDHIQEFRRESELVALAEQHGFRVQETLSVAPARLLPNARYLPRSMGLVMHKRKHDTW